MSFNHIIKRLLSLRRFDNERVVPLQSPRGKCESLPVLPKSFENKFAVATEPQRGELKCSPALDDYFVDKISVVPKLQPASSRLFEVVNVCVGVNYLKREPK